MNRDHLLYELNLFFVPFYCEQASVRFWIIWFLGFFLVLFFRLSTYLLALWGFGYLIFGTLLAWKEGVFEVDVRS